MPFGTLDTEIVITVNDPNLEEYQIERLTFNPIKITIQIEVSTDYSG